MGWWQEAYVRVTHIPTGVSVYAEFGRSLWRMRERCFQMLKGKLWSLENAEPSDALIVRSYTEADFNRLDIVEMPKHES